MVEHVLRLRANLYPIATERNRPEQRRVHVPVAWRPELVAAGVPPCITWLRECGRVVPPLVGSWFAEARLRISDDVDRLQAARLLQQPVVPADREGCPRQPGGDAVHLPALDKVCEGLVACPRKGQL